MMQTMLASDRLLIFGGPYGNLQATTALLGRADELGFESSELLCTGDTVAYCAQPQETVGLIRSRGIVTVMGNCEESLAEDSDDCGCGFEEGSTCSALSAEWYQYCRANLTAETKQWMGGLPRAVEVEIAGRRLRATHATPDAINEFVFAEVVPKVKRKYLVQSGCDGLLVGHSGIPFVEVMEDRLRLRWVNSLDLSRLGYPNR